MASIGWRVVPNCSTERERAEASALWPVTRCLRAVAVGWLARQETNLAGSAAWLTLAEDWEGSAAGGKQAMAGVPRRELLRCGVVLLAVGSA
jgi:hypothetical protein